MNFLNIEKNKILRAVFFLEKQFFLISRLMLFSTLKKNNIEKCPFTYWLNGRWFLQIVDRDSWNLYLLYPLFPCSDFVSQMWGSQWFGGGGGVVMFFSYFMLFTTFLEKKNLGILKKTIISHLMFSSCVFYVGNIEKCPFTYWLNGEVVSPNS